MSNSEFITVEKKSAEMPSKKLRDNHLINSLEKLGRLPKNFDGNVLIDPLKNGNEKLRKLAAVNIGKLKNVKFLQPLLQTAKYDSSTMVRREATSAIGRMKNELVIPALTQLTDDDDPKVVLQALRGLLHYPKNTIIHEVLEKLKQHPNEMVREIIEKERTYYFDLPNSNEENISSPDYLKNVVAAGNVLDTIKTIPNNSIHLTFTSPPYYNARDYSIYSSYAEYLKFLEKVFKQVHRVTKEGRFFILNTSPVIVPRVSRSHSSKRYPIPFDIHPLLVKMGWEFIDDIVWAKPEASVKNRNGGFYQHRKPLAYKPNCCTEYLMVYRKKTHRLIDWNIRQYPYQKIKDSLVGDSYETSNVWKIDPVFDKTHSAVFPSALCSRVIRYYSMAHDLVFDPFGGSGTLGITAAYLDRFFFMTELSDQYVERIKEKFSKNKDFFLPEPKYVCLAQLKKMKKDSHE